ncbi:MAG: glycosyltransferase [Opitutaceae bacterium]
MPRPSPFTASLPARFPRLSVVVPLFNCLSLTRELFAGLQRSMPRDVPHEIIFVDDGSTDGTREWLASVGPGFRVVLNERNLGYAAANNRAAAIAQGELLLLLNNDLVLRPGWLEPMLALHRRLGTQAGLIGNIQRAVGTGAIDHTGIAINFKGKPEHDRHRPWWGMFPGSWRRAVAVTGACLLIERSLWTQLGGFDETYVNGCEDIDLGLRASAAGRINAVSLRSVVGHHISASPGRKRRDEENTFKLAHRWRDSLVLLGVKAWCRHYLETNWTTSRDPAGHSFAREIFLHAYGLKRRPPDTAIEGMNRAMDGEMARWREMFEPRRQSLPES